MIRALFSSLMAIHGVIHLIGFVREWNPRANGRSPGKSLFPFSGSMLKILGLGWLLACILLIASGIAYYYQKEWFWLPVASGLTLSQVLVILYWKDAKWGTFINVIVAIATVFTVMATNYNNMVAGEIRDMVSATSKNDFSVTEEMIAKTPPIIQAWLTKSNIKDRTFPGTVYVRQHGLMRSDKNGAWMPFDAEQYFTIQPPAFVWRAHMHVNSIIDIAARDKFESGKGNMLIKAGAVIPMANSSGKEIDQGAMTRFMAEIMWFPHAMLCDYLEWEQLDDRRVRCTMRYNDATVTGVYTFNDEGFPIGFEAQRYGEFDKEFRQETWSIAITGYRHFNGMPIGHSSEVTWKLKEGDFTWLKLEVLEVKYQ